MPDHLAFGLRLRSAEALPGLPVADAVDRADVQVHLGQEAPWAGASRTLRYTSPDAAPGESPTVVAYEVPATGGLTLEYDEGIRFDVGAHGREVWGAWRAPLTRDDAMTFLLGPVLGYVLRRRGMLALHASAAVFQNVAVAFVGPGGAGKSTLAAACAKAGHAVVTDDVLVVREEAGQWWTTAAPGPVRLWPDSASALFGRESPTTALSPTWPKLGLALEAAGLPRATEPVPLGALLVLDDRVAGAAPPHIGPLRGHEALLRLAGNTYASYLLDPADRAAELRAIGRLVGVVPVRRLVPGEGAGALEALITEVARFVRRPAS